MKEFLLIANSFFLSKKKNSLFLAIKHPGHYLLQLVVPAVGVGVVTFLLSWFYTRSSLYNVAIVPVSMHSVIGLVIGLLLVFRTNTAYDRWWSGRKYIAELLSTCAVARSYSENLRLSISNYVDAIEAHLTGKLLAQPVFKNVNHVYTEAELYFGDKAAAQRLASELTMIFSNMEKIKNTPIPLSYSLHIKASLSLYILSLPFGVFHDMGVWSSPVVMLVFYVAFGIEIISNEIEDPFHGDPNDLPVKKHLDDCRNLLR